jgi:hypothetical protein
MMTVSPCPTIGGLMATGRLQQRVTMIAMCLITLALVAVDASVRPIAVAVVASRDVTDSLVNRICAEADAIWAPAGVAFEWNRDASKDEAHRLTIEVTIDDRRTPAGGDDALGWLTFAGNSPDRVIHLSRPTAEGLLRDWPGLNDATITTHEALIGRALGRALAHELGHYIFRSKVHTRRGLMRKAWTSGETFARSRIGFELTPQELATAAAYLSRASNVEHNLQNDVDFQQAHSSYQ